MQVDFLLKGILKKHKLDHHGVIRRLAEYTNVSRHTIRKLLNNTAPSVSFQVLGAVRSMA